MDEQAQPVLMTVLAGHFVNQAAAFFALRHEALKLDVAIDERDLDVIREAAEVRLAHYFRPAIVARIEEAREADNTVILLFPSRLTTFPAFPPEDSALRLLGRFAGRLSFHE